MVTIMESHYKADDGKDKYTVFYNGTMQCAATEDEKFAAQYARELYHLAKSPARLVYWDGVTGLEKVIEVK